MMREQRQHCEINIGIDSENVLTDSNNKIAQRKIP